MTPDPTVTAVSINEQIVYVEGKRAHGWAACECERCKVNDATVGSLRELLRARSALADVGECKNPECEDGQVPTQSACWKPCSDCTGKQPRPSTVVERAAKRMMATDEFQQHVGKQPRPADALELLADRVACGPDRVSRTWLMEQLSALSPAAHTAQGDDTQRMDWLEAHSSPAASDCQWRCHERLNGQSFREAIDDAMSRLAEQGSAKP